MLRLRREGESKRPEEAESPDAAAQDAASPAGTPPDAGAGARADAFVSYARRDEPFVRNVLVDALVGRGKEVWLDVKDIPPAADWRDRIRAGIEAARAFVFVISADSAASKPCLDELRQAGELNKPLIVVVREDVPRERLPAALEPVEWIFMRESDALEDGIEQIVAALEVDLAWRDLHNELAVRASEWEREGRDGALLLRGRALAEAEQWQADPGPHRESPTPEQTAYIQAGRQAAGRRTRILVGSVTTALAISLALAAYAFVQRGQAVSREHTATSLALAAASSRELRGNLGSSLVLGLEAMHARATPNARNAMISALEQARRNGLEAVLCCHKGALDSLAFSPDGKTAAAGADDGTVLIWDLGSRRLLARIEQAHETAVRSVAFSPDGKTLASGSAESVELWDARTAERSGGSEGARAAGRTRSPSTPTATRSPAAEGASCSGTHARRAGKAPEWAARAA